MKTMQMQVNGKWVNIQGHDCRTDEDFEEYVAAFPQMRAADDSTEGEPVESGE